MTNKWSLLRHFFWYIAIYCNILQYSLNNVYFTGTIYCTINCGKVYFLIFYFARIRYLYILLWEQIFTICIAIYFFQGLVAAPNECTAGKQIARGMRHEKNANLGERAGFPCVLLKLVNGHEHDDSFITSRTKILQGQTKCRISRIKTNRHRMFAATRKLLPSKVVLFFSSPQSINLVYSITIIVVG